MAVNYSRGRKQQRERKSSQKGYDSVKAEKGVGDESSNNKDNEESKSLRDHMRIEFEPSKRKGL